MKRRQFLTTTAGAAGALIAGIRSAQARPCSPPAVNVAGGGSVNTSCTPTIGVPSWFSALTNKKWATPVSNWLGDAAVKDPLADSTNAATTGHKSLIIAWTGMGADESRKMIWMAGNGGHADYAGNEVYSCDLTLANPVWTRRRNASAAPPNNQQVWTKWSDNTPPSDHTGMHQIGAEGRWFKLGLGSPNWVGSPAGQQAWEFNPVNNAWIDRGQNLVPDVYGITGCAAFDPKDRQLIKVRATGKPAVQFIDIDTFATALTAGEDVTSSSIIVASVDTQNHLLLWRAGDTNYQSSYYLLDLDNKSAGWTNVPVTNPDQAPPATFAFHWHTPSNAFITWDGAGGLKRLTPTMNGRKYSALTWSSVSGNGGPAPTKTIDLMYNKIQLIRDMGNGDSALVVVPQYGAPDVYVMRIIGAV